MPQQEEIAAFKGLVDFYEWKGIHCARKWPTWPAREPHPDEKANQDDFAYAVKNIASMSDYIIDRYKALAVSTPWTWRDLAIRGYMKGLPY